MKNKLVTLIALIFIGGSCKGQITFQNVYTSTHLVDGIITAAQTPDGGYFAAGLANDDIWLVKLNAYGDTIWARTYPGYELGTIGQLATVEQTFDSGYIMTGSDECGIFLIRADSVGETIWTKAYGGAYCETHGIAVHQTADSGFIIGGTGTEFTSGGYDFLLIKTDKNGATLWSKSYGTIKLLTGYYDDVLNDMQITREGGYIMAGTRSSYGPEEALIIKTDSAGNPIWNNIYGDTLNFVFHTASSIRQTSDNGYIVRDDDEEYDIFKLDSNGAIQWIKNYMMGGFNAPIIPTKDGGYMLTGFQSLYQVNLIKVNSTGDSLWLRTYDKLGFGSVEQTNDGGFILGGGYADSANSGQPGRSAVVKTDSSGNSVCNGVLTNPPYFYPDSGSILQIVDTTPTIIVQRVFPIVGSFVTIAENTNLKSTPCLLLGEDEILNKNSINLYPNPPQTN